MNNNKLTGQKPHIGIFGRRNVGKSSLINTLAQQEVAIVADYPGTTTDPVKKTMEVAELGPVIFIDTAGIDDEGLVGEKRIAATRKILAQVDLAVILFSNNQWEAPEHEIVIALEQTHTPYFIIHHKSDQQPLQNAKCLLLEQQYRTSVLAFSSKQYTTNELTHLITLLKKYLPQSAYNNPTILGDLVHPGDLVLLVTPIDIEAPQGRLILPQVQTIRDALDHECLVMMLKERELEVFWQKIKVPPQLVITDSQAFLKVAASIPPEIPLTSFSILFARLKGAFSHFLAGTRHIAHLQDGNRILIYESCSHHVTGDDIGRVKIPRWLANFTGKKLEFEVIAGLDLPSRPIVDYSLVIQCGGCMMTRKQILNRLQIFIDQHIPVTNYGMAIAYCHGIFERAVALFSSQTSMDL